MKKRVPQFLLILLGVVTLGAAYAGTKLGNLKEAAESLQYQVNQVQLYKVDLQAKKIEVKLNVDFTNITDTTLTVDNLVVKVHIPDGRSGWLQLATSRPTGKVSVVPGHTSLPLKFEALIASEFIAIIPRLIQGQSQRLMVEIFPQVAGHNLKPVTAEVEFSKDSIFRSFGIGYTGDGPVKKINLTKKYDHLFPLASVKGTEEHIGSGSHYGTLDEMKRIVRQTLGDTKEIAKELGGAGTRMANGTKLKRVFDFANEHIQYKLDDPGKEQLRRPARTWKDRVTGVDCDCFSIFISSILTNIGIPHSFRMAAYDANKSFAHVYVVAYHQGREYILDPVKGKWNVEHGPITKQYDLKVL